MKEILQLSCRIFLLVALVWSVTAFFACKAPRTGSDTKEGLVGTFISALHGRNFTALNSLVEPGYDASSEVEQLFELYGGCEFSAVKIDVKTNTVAGFLADAHVSGICRKAALLHQFKLDMSMIEENGKWFIELGKRDDGSAIPAWIPSTTMSPEKK